MNGQVPVDRLVGICRTVMRNDTVEASTDLWMLGISSLTAVRLRAHVRAELGRDIDMARVLDCSTPADLAAAAAGAPRWTDDMDD